MRALTPNFANNAGGWMFFINRVARTQSGKTSVTIGVSATELLPIVSGCKNASCERSIKFSISNCARPSRIFVP